MKTFFDNFSLLLASSLVAGDYVKKLGVAKPFAAMVKTQAAATNSRTWQCGCRPEEFQNGVTTTKPATVEKPRRRTRKMRSSRAGRHYLRQDREQSGDGRSKSYLPTSAGCPRACP